MSTLLKIANLLIVSLLFIIISGCVRSGQGDFDQLIGQFETDQPEPHRIGSFLCEDIISNHAINHFQFAFECVKGKNFIDSNQLDISLVKYKDRVEFELIFNVSQFGEFPTVYNRDFEKKELADNLYIEVKVSNKNLRKNIVFRSTEHIASDSTITFASTLNLADFSSLKEGLQSFNLSIDTRYASFFRVLSSKHAIMAELKFDFYVPPIYVSEVYFNELVLNKSQVTDFLGDNDWDDPTPEAGIYISYRDQTVIYSHSKNSFSYQEKLAEKFYHLSESDSIRIAVLDVDYGFNASDLISDTILPIKSLDQGNYVDLPLDMVDKLLVFTKFIGRVNG